MKEKKSCDLHWLTGIIIVLALLKEPGLKTLFDFEVGIEKVSLSFSL